jgi:hypothetical protein
MHVQNVFCSRKKRTFLLKLKRGFNGQVHKKIQDMTNDKFLQCFCYTLFLGLYSVECNILVYSKVVESKKKIYIYFFFYFVKIKMIKQSLVAFFCVRKNSLFV